MFRNVETDLNQQMMVDLLTKSKPTVTNGRVAGIRITSNRVRKFAQAP